MLRFCELLRPAICEYHYAAILIEVCKRMVITVFLEQLYIPQFCPATIMWQEVERGIIYPYQGCISVELALF